MIAVVCVTESGTAATLARRRGRNSEPDTLAGPTRKASHLSSTSARVTPNESAVRRATVRLGIRILAIAAIGGTFGVPGLIGGSPAVAAEAACGNGVAVVVDFTGFEIDGQAGTVEVRCADGDPENGRAALAAAGFTLTDSQPGFLCAIDANPDPCPATFDGSFWSYWHSTRDGEWTSYQVGADSSNPVPGEIEGWRYNDGTTAPGIAPADVAGALDAARDGAGSGTATNGSATPSDQAQTNAGRTSTDQARAAQAQAAQNLALTATAIGFLALIIILVTIFVVRARRRGPGTSD